MKFLNRAYKQPNAWTCGPAVARIILYFFGFKREIRELSRAMKTNKSGTENKFLIGHLKKHKIKAKPKINARFGELKKATKENLVVVSYWIPRHQESHFSIVKKIDSKRIYFHDTWFGSNHSYSIEYFLKNWRDEENKRWLLSIKK